MRPTEDPRVGVFRLANLKVVFFLRKWFDQTSRGMRDLKRHYIIEVRHTRKYEAYDPFIITQNVKKVYYAPYLLCRNNFNWWIVIKTKMIEQV